MAHKVKGMTSYRIDRRYKGVGRIALSAGTSNLGVFNGILAMLSDLEDRGRLDDLHAIQRRHVAPLVAYNAWKENRLVGTASVANVLPLEPTLRQWLKSYDIADTTRVGYRNCINQLLKSAKAGATVADIPKTLESYRRLCQRNGVGKSFNQTKAVLLAYANEAYTANSTVYRDIHAVKGLAYSKLRQNNPMSPREIRELCSKLPDELAAMVWTMVTTSMGPKEYLIDGFIDHGYGIEILGKKTDNRTRFVPRIFVPATPVRAYKALNKAVKSVRKDINLYDLRRTYAVWSEAAGILPSHHKAYMGHRTIRSMTELYTQQDMAKHLAADGTKLTAFVHQDLYPGRVVLNAAGEAPEMMILDLPDLTPAQKSMQAELDQLQRHREQLKSGFIAIEE